jgi:hypothetical protein
LKYLNTNTKRYKIRYRYDKTLTLLVCLGAAALAGTASPLSTSFAYTGGFQTFVAPTTGLYDIVAFGAQGGIGFGFIPGFPGVGGLGTEIGGTFALTAGEMLQVAVGGEGGSNAAFSSGGGGGGGSFVVAPGNVPLVIAGGGGGGGIGMLAGGAGQISAAGGAGIGLGSGMGGVNGNGGHGVPVVGAAGGGGFYTAGGGGGLLVLGGGSSFLAGLNGGGDPTGIGASGGFGGGGAGFADGTLNDGSGGGGGGYSGGGGGDSPGNGAFTGSGGGGGSFDAGADQVLMAGVNGGNGSVVITELTPQAAPVPEPASLTLFGASLAGLLGLRRLQLLCTAR